MRGRPSGCYPDAPSPVSGSTPPLSASLRGFGLFPRGRRGRRSSPCGWRPSSSPEELRDPLLEEAFGPRVEELSTLLDAQGVDACGGEHVDREARRDVERVRCVVVSLAEGSEGSEDGQFEGRGDDEPARAAPLGALDDVVLGPLDLLAREEPRRDGSGGARSRSLARGRAFERSGGCGGSSGSCWCSR